MSKTPSTFSNASGQVMMIGVLLLTLLLAGITAVFFFNQTGTFHNTSSAQRVKAESVAKEGLAYATRQLSENQATWEAALGASFDGTQPGAKSTDCNMGVITSPAGGRFMLYCSTGMAGNPLMEFYQVAVTATAVAPNTANTPLRAIKAYISKRTLGTDLASDVHAPAAVQLARQPNISGDLNVHWGPIVCLDSKPIAWTGLISTDRYPRKFSQGGMSAASFGNIASVTDLTTDHKEYWAFASQSSPPMIQEASYITQSLGSGGVPVPGGVGGPGDATYLCGVANCGYFNTQGATAVFDGPGQGYSPPPFSIIYIDGSAEFDNVDMQDVTMIITGNLTINNVTNAAGSANRRLHVPISAPAEYPYYLPDHSGLPANWPCSGNWPDSTASCPPGSVFATSKVHFRGFLYVKGNLTVKSPNTFNMVGSLLVGDSLAIDSGHQLVIEPNANLNVAYDDRINQVINIYPVSNTLIRLEPDVIQDVPAI